MSMLPLNVTANCTN